MNSTYAISVAVVMTSVIPFVLYSLRRKRLSDEMVLCGPYLTVYALSAFLQIILSYFSIKNHWVISTTYLLEFIAISYFYRQWEESHRWKTLLSVVLATYACFWIVAKLTIEEFNGLSPYSGPIELLLVVLFSIRILAMLALKSDRPLYLYGEFWIAIGIVFASSADFFMAAIYPRIVQFSKIDYFRFLLIHWTRLLLVNAVFAIALFLKEKTVRQEG